MSGSIAEAPLSAAALAAAAAAADALCLFSLALRSMAARRRLSRWTLFSNTPWWTSSSYSWLVAAEAAESESEVDVLCLEGEGIGRQAGEKENEK